MNQEKIGQFIKEIRKKEGLTQEKFALKYGVTYQAVSKWENGKNIPDITILKQMCNDYKMDLNDLLEGEKDTKNDKKKMIIIWIVVIIIVIVGICLLLFFNKDDKKDNDDFEFKQISSTCDNFNLYGSIAYNSNKTSIHISNISYCGNDNEVYKNQYKEIECVLYEVDDNTKTKISSYNYKEDETISLTKFLESVNFNIDHYSETCKMYKENGMYLEIKATNTNNQTIFYNIPLKLEENCN